MSESPSPHLSSAVLDGRYVVREKLGAGSLGTVYLAYDEVAARLVALKLIRTDRPSGLVSRSMQEEFRAIALLSHPRIARGYDFGYTEAGVPYYTREYIEGLPLPPGPPGPRVTPAEFLRPILDLLEALDYLHSQGVLHLDIHAGNLIVASEAARGSVLIDHGLVRSGEPSLFSVRGDSWSAFPPEILERRDASPRSDLFLAGRLLYYRLTGRTQGKPSLPREIPGWGTHLTLELERIIAKALQPLPEERFQSAAEFHDAFSNVLGRRGEGLQRAQPGHQLVGRGDELERIDEAVRSAARGARSLLWFVGASGIGKTRLLSEARLRAQLRGLQAVEARFLPDQDPAPVLLRALRSRAGKAGPPRWLEPLDPSCGGTPEKRAARAARAFFDDDKERGLVVILDDFELADPASRRLAAALIAEIVREQGSQPGRGLAILAASSRPPSPRLVPKEVAARRVLRLRGLDPAESRELLERLVSPLETTASLVEKAVRRARGVPLSLRQIAVGLCETWKRAGAIPPGAELPALEASSGGAVPNRARLDPDERSVLEALAVLSRAATRSELVDVLEVPPRSLDRILRRLVKLEVLVAEGRGAARRYQWAEPRGAERFIRRLPDRFRRRIHRTLARFLEASVRGQPSPGGRDLENLARHLLALGRSEEAYDVVLRAARELRRVRCYERAASLLEESFRVQEDPSRALVLAEELSDLLTECGDHEKAIHVLEPFYRAGSPDGGGVRVRRRLGIHYHRAGRPQDALRVFEEARALATGKRDVEDLLFIDCELAELQLFLGNHEAAEEACRRGLASLEEEAPGSAGRPRGKLEVLLRASLGHIELRRLRLDAAYAELLRALDLSRCHEMAGDRAAILHNLGVTENERSRFEESRRYFEEARALLLRAGRRAEAVKICTNLALIEAKLGRRDEARAQVAQAQEMLRRCPGDRLECFVAYSRGLVSHLFGESDAAVEDLESAAGLAERLGDVSLGRFALVHLAEAHLLSGRYTRALAALRSARGDGERDQPVIDRMVECRRLLLETLIARSRHAGAARERLERLPRTQVAYLEAWNDLVLAMVQVVEGKGAREELDDVLSIFERLGVPAGCGFARLGIMVEALVCRDLDALGVLAPREPSSREHHNFLRVAEALVAAEGYARIDDNETAERWLAVASSGIIGSRFLELDWRLELLRTRLAVQKGELADARRHLHRALHSRDLLLQFVPKAARKRFSEQTRFAALSGLTSRLETTRAPELSTARLRRLEVYEGMVGTSRAMVEVFQTIEKIREQHVAVLVTGETGTGKELVARAIHARSTRRDGPFRSVCCACLPPELFESEFFGHAAGAFTDAAADRPGILEDASGGTLLLDEVSLLPLESQAKLLRALESGTVRRLGSLTDRRVDVRFIAATSADLREAAERGAFRADLYYRLAGIEIRVPPLRERREDIPVLARHLLERHAGRLDRSALVLSPDASAFLGGEEWRGNVRELEMLLLRASVQLADPARLEASDLEALRSRLSPEESSDELLEKDLGELRRDLERRYLTALFFRCGGDTQEMMRVLDVKSTKLYAWLRDLGVEIRELRRRLRRRR